MAKILARNWKFYIYESTDATTGDDTFQRILGINTFTLGTGSEQTDTTDFDSAGFTEHLVTERSNTVSIEGNFIEDSAGVRDPGQDLVETLAEKVGAGSVDRIRIISPSGKTKEYNVSASIADVGGGNTDTTSWGADFAVSGQPVVVSDTAIYEG